MTARATSATWTGPFDTASKPQKAGVKATGSAVKDQAQPGERFTGTNDLAQYREGHAMHSYGAGSIAAGGSAMYATSEGTAFDSDYTDGAGSGGGSMQGGAFTSFGNPAGATISSVPNAGLAEAGQQPMEGMSERQERGDTPHPDPGEYPDTGRD